MSQYMPSPWTARLLDVQTYVVGGGDGIGRPTICELPRFPTQSPAQVRQVEANARLIAAAPELLEAAKRIRDVKACMMLDGIHGGFLSKEILAKYGVATVQLLAKSAEECAEAAIAKAEGREPMSLQEEIDRS